MAALSRGLRRALVIVFLAFAAVGSYYAWTGPEGDASAERAPLVVVDSGDAGSDSGMTGGPERLVAERAPEARRASPSTLAEVVTRPIAEPTAAVPSSEPRAEVMPEPVVAEDVIEILPPRMAAEFESDEEPGSSEPGVEVAGESASSEAPASARRHRVQSGETLSSIAERFYGEASAWRRIAEANPDLDVDRLAIGTEIVLPAIELPSTAEPVVPATPAPSGRVHVVAEGETLSSIAATLYGDSSKWRSLYEANRASIGADPGAIRVGMRLVVPSNP
jgi:nucleoid-associated protein YgaU